MDQDEPEWLREMRHDVRATRDSTLRMESEMRSVVRPAVSQTWTNKEALDRLRGALSSMTWVVVFLTMVTLLLGLVQLAQALGATG